MTLEEAKKILEKEFAVISLHKSTEPFEFDESGWIEHEKPSVLEAFRVLSKGCYYISISGHDYDMRKKRLQKEYEKNAKAPGSSENRIKEDSGVNPALKESASQFNDALLDEQAKKIGEQNKELTRLISLVEKKENSISRLYYEKSVLEKENEDLKKGEIPARYFDKALVDEQSEKIKKLEHEKLDILEMASSCKQTIAELTKEKKNLEDQITVLNACKEHNENVDRKQIKRLSKEIARLNKIIHKKNLKIEELRKEGSRFLRGKIKTFGENMDLKGKLKDKDAVLSDVAEDLRLTKIREKNLTEVCQKYVNENEKLKSNLADKIVVKIDAQALKSAESALAYKEKVIAEKDEVIADLGNELAATKKELEEKTKLVEVVRKGSKEYCEYGIAAEKMIRKMANVIVYEGKVSSKEFEEYRRWANGYRFNPQLYDFIEEEEKKLEHAKKIRVSSDNAEEGADLYGVIVLCGKDLIDALNNVKDVWQE